MRTLRILLIALCVVAVSGCACRTRKVGEGEGNIPVAAEGDILKDINFAFDSYKLSDAAKATLQDSADWLKANPGKSVVVEGHCDERGTSEYNMALGAHRAQAAADYLRSLGVEGARMSTISYGKELPLDPRHNEEAWAKNRRDHFVVK